MNNKKTFLTSTSTGSKKSLKTILSYGIFVASFVFGSSSVLAGEDLDRVLAKKELVVATSGSWPPQAFLNDKNEMDGFDIDVAKEVGKRLNVKVSFVTPDWSVITSGKWYGRWDMSVGSMTPTKARAKVLNFPAIYYYSPYVFAVHTDSALEKRADLNGKVIGLEAATTSESYINRNLVIDAQDVPPFVYDVTPGKVKSYASSIAPLDDLRLGDGVRLHAILGAQQSIEAAIKNGYPIKILNDSPAYYEPLAIAIAIDDSEFSQRISEIIKELQSDGTLQSLSLKWYGVDYSKLI